MKNTSYLSYDIHEGRRKTKVTDLNVILRVKEDVDWLKIPMDYSLQ